MSLNTVKFKNNVATEGHVRLSEIETQRTPSVGHNLLYSRTDKRVYTLDSSNNEFMITAPENSSSGLVSGGEVTVGTGGLGVATTFNVAAGFGVIVESDPYLNTLTQTSVSWEESLDVSLSHLATSSLSVICIDSSGDIVQLAQNPTNSENRNLIILGGIAHTTNTVIQTVTNTPTLITAPMAHLRDLAKAVGKLNIEGNGLSPNADLTFQKGAGVIYALNQNIETNPNDPSTISLIALDTTAGVNPNSFRYVFQDGSSSAFLSDVIPNIKDEIVGGVSNAPYPGTTYANNRYGTSQVYLSSTNEIAIHAPQNEYSSMANAIDGIQTDAFYVASIIKDNFVLIGYLITQGNATDLSDDTEALFINAAKFGSTTSSTAITSLQKAYDNSTPPQIVTNETLNAVEIQMGNGVGQLDTDNALLIRNQSSVATFEVQGNGTTIINKNSTSDSDTAMRIVHDADTFADTTAIDVSYNTGPQTGTIEAGVLINLDTTESVSGAVVGFGVLTTAGNATSYGMYAGAEVRPIVQGSGIFAPPSTGSLDVNGAPTALGALSAVDLWAANSDYIIVSHNVKYNEIAFDLSVVASGSGIKPTFEYSTGAGPTWASFTPTDGTSGMRNKGTVSWQVNDIPSWSADASLFKIRITRTQNSLSTVPILNDDGIFVAVTTVYFWSEDGELVVRRINVEDIESNVPTLTVKNTDTVAGSMTSTIEMRDNSDVLATDLTLSGGNLTLSNNISSGNTSLATANRTLTLDETNDRLIPVSDGTMDLGGLSNQFNNAYFDGTVNGEIFESATASVLSIAPSTATGVELSKLNALTKVLGSLTVDQDLVVNGTTTSVNTANVNVADAYIYSNNGYTTNVATTGGAVVNYFPTALSDTVAATGFTAGVASTSNPTVATTGAATFSVSDIIQISGANNPTNNGIFEVLSHSANVLTVRGVGTTSTVEDFPQTDFVTDTTVAGTITKINVAVMRIGADGVWENGVGSATPITYNDIIDVASAVNTSITGTGALDSGSITSNFGDIDNGTSSITTGDLTVDQVNIDGGLITMTGTTGNNQIVLVDNLADAFSFQESTNKYMTFVTTDGGESIDISKNLDVIAGDYHYKGDIGIITETGHGTDNYFISTSATIGDSVTTGVNNYVWGTGAGIAITEGIDNVLIGDSTGSLITTGDYNILIGNSSGTAITDAVCNIVLGDASNTNNTGSYNTILGSNSFQGIGDASFNISVGDACLQAVTTGQDNTVIGHSSGNTITTGSWNTVLGPHADSAAGINFSVAIGYGTVTTATSEMRIGSTTLANTINRILPGITNTTNIGSGTFAFNHAYFGGIVQTDDIDARTATTLRVGKGTATKVEIADTGIITEIQGPLTASETSNLVGVVTMGTGGTNYTLPTTRGTDTQVLTTNGSGVATWQDASGGVSVAHCSRQRTIASTTSQLSINVFHGTAATTEIITDKNITFATGADITDGTFTIDSGYDGDYFIQCNVIIGNGIGVSDVITWKINKGATYASTKLTSGTINPYDNRSLELTMSCIAPLVAGDIITFWVDTAGTTNINAKIGTTCSIHKLGGFVGPAGADGSNGVSITNLTAGELENPGITDWAVNALAPLTADVIYPALLVRAFDPTISEGVGWVDALPIGSTTMDITLTTRADSTPGSTLTGIFALKYRQISGTIGSWQSHTLDTISYTNANGTAWLKTVITVDYTDPTTNFIAGETYQFELVRDITDTLTVDILLSNVNIQYTPLVGITGTLQSSYNASSNGEIVTDATRESIVFQNGNSLDSDNVIEVKNIAGDTTFSVAGSGAVSIIQKKVTIDSSSTNQTPALTDLNSVTVFDNNAVINYTLPDMSVDEDGYILTFINDSTGAKTIVANTNNPDTIDGAANIVLSSQHDRVMLLYHHASLRWYTM